MLSAIVTFTLSGCWRPRGYNRALHFVPPFFQPSITCPYGICLSRAQFEDYYTPRFTLSDSGLLAGVMPIIHCGAQRPLLPVCPMSHFILCTHSVPFFYLCLYNLRHTARCSFFCQSFKNPTPTFPLVGDVSNLLFYSISKTKMTKNICICIYTCLSYYEYYNKMEIHCFDHCDLLL